MKMKKKSIKKKLEDFIKDESGEISRDKILKIGLGTISALGILSAFSANVIATHSSHVSHENNLGLFNVTKEGAGGTPEISTHCFRVDHASHTSHGSHSSY